jgi:aspartate racemase
LAEPASCLGLVGGLGVGATVHYYQALANAHERVQKPLRLVIVNADVRRVLADVQANRLQDLTTYLNSILLQLEKAGATFGAIPAVTPHICFAELLARSPWPLINLLEVARESIADRRVALFGTRFTIQTNLFGALPESTTIRPLPDEIDQIHEIYSRTASQGTGSEVDRQILTTLAHALIARESLDAIVLAGTDLTLLFDESNTSFPAIDCARLHIDAILKQLLG